MTQLKKEYKDAKSVALKVPSLKSPKNESQYEVSMNLSKSTKGGPAFPQNYSVMDPQIEKSGNKGHYTQES